MRLILLNINFNRILVCMSFSVKHYRCWYTVDAMVHCRKNELLQTGYHSNDNNVYRCSFGFAKQYRTWGNSLHGFLTLLHSKWPKLMELHGVLAIMSAIGMKMVKCKAQYG